MRIQKFLRNNKFGSLRKCDELVQSKKVKINNVLLSDPTYYLKEGDEVNVDGLIKTFNSVGEFNHSTFLFHKPTRVICSHTDIIQRKTVFHFFQEVMKNQSLPLFYGGRLDYMSRGLMLISTDGKFIQNHTHPSFGIKKTYKVTVRESIDFDLFENISNGFTFGEITYLGFEFDTISDNEVFITLVEGKNQEIRNIFRSMNNEVTDLFRIKIGNFKVDGLQAGQYIKI